MRRSCSLSIDWSLGEEMDTDYCMIDKESSLNNGGDQMRDEDMLSLGKYHSQDLQDQTYFAAQPPAHAVIPSTEMDEDQQSKQDHQTIASTPEEVRKFMRGLDRIAQGEDWDSREVTPHEPSAGDSRYGFSWQDPSHSKDATPVEDGYQEHALQDDSTCRVPTPSTTGQPDTCNWDLPGDEQTYVAEEAYPNEKTPSRQSSAGPQSREMTPPTWNHQPSKEGYRDRASSPFVGDSLRRVDSRHVTVQNNITVNMNPMTFSGMSSTPTVVFSGKNDMQESLLAVGELAAASGVRSIPTTPRGPPVDPKDDHYGPTSPSLKRTKR